MFDTYVVVVIVVSHTQCTGFMMSLKGLPSAYNKDLQDDKAAMFDTYVVVVIVFSHTQCTGFMMSLKGLPSAYNKDLQDD